VLQTYAFILRANDKKRHFFIYQRSLSNLVGQYVSRYDNRCSKLFK